MGWWHFAFLTRCRTLCEVSRSSECKQWENSFPPKDPLGLTLVCTALCFSFLTTVILGVFVKHQDTPTVKANKWILSYIPLISLTLCFLCSLLFIIYPNTAICILWQITFRIVFAVAVPTVLAKTITVVLEFKVPALGRRMRQCLESGPPNFAISICSLIQMILSGIWFRTSPPFIDKDAHTEPGYITIECLKGSATAFYCVLGYLGCLALWSFNVAFMARNLLDTLLVFCRVWVSFLSVYHSTKGKVMAAIEIFSSLASSAGLLGYIFAPRCYIILLRPDRNTHHGLWYRTYSVDNKTS